MNLPSVLLKLSLVAAIITQFNDSLTEQVLPFAHTDFITHQLYRVLPRSSVMGEIEKKPLYPHSLFHCL